MSQGSRFTQAERASSGPAENAFNLASCLASENRFLVERRTELLCGSTEAMCVLQQTRAGFVAIITLNLKVQGGKSRLRLEGGNCFEEEKSVP